jgi:hypothetical protein
MVLVWWLIRGDNFFWTDAFLLNSETALFVVDYGRQLHSNYSSVHWMMLIDSSTQSGIQSHESASLGLAVLPLYLLYTCFIRNAGMVSFDTMLLSRNCCINIVSIVCFTLRTGVKLTHP